MGAQTNDIYRLPKWAQNEIVQLKERVRQLEGQLKIAERVHTPGGRVHIPTGLLDTTALDVNRVEFDVGPTLAGDRPRRVQVIVKDDGLHLQGDGKLVVRPNAANCVIVQLESY